LSSAWRAEPIWKGETCYIVGGGPSLLTQPIDVLAGNKVIAINSSYAVVPEAQFVVFADMRWWCEHIKKRDWRNYRGKIISCSASASGPNLFSMQRKTTPGLADDPGTLMVKNTTLTAAINLAVHLGVSKIVLLGIDQCKAPDGRTHHHAPHPWKQTPDCYARQSSDLPRVAKDLQERGIECVNASPGSALKLWPIVDLQDHVVAAESIAA
jgi:hypothetical protein